MEWLAADGCRFDSAQEKRGTGHANVATVHREGRTAEVPLGGPHQILRARILRRACDETGPSGGTEDWAPRRLNWIAASTGRMVFIGTLTFHAFFREALLLFLSLVGITAFG
jgi:hypothetical protein